MTTAKLSSMQAQHHTHNHNVRDHVTGKGKGQILMVTDPGLDLALRVLRLGPCPQDDRPLIC